MNIYATNIVTNGVSGVATGLSFIPNLTAEEFAEAADLAIAQLQAAKTTFTAASTEDVALKVEQLVYNGLEVAKNAVDSTGDTKYDTYFTIAENVDTQIEQGSFGFISAIKAWFQAKKAAKAA